MTLPNRKPGGIPAATIARLPVYHRVLSTFGSQGIVTIASEELAAACGVSPAKLRKDLSHLGSFGTRGVGYNVSYLTFQIARELGVTKSRGIVIVGMGNLGRALASYRAFGARGFHIVRIFDRDHELVGNTLLCGQESFTVMPVSDLAAVVSKNDANIGVITTPAESAQEIADLMIEAGLVSILNFAPVFLKVPEEVEVRKVDLAVELQILAFHDQKLDSEPSPHELSQVDIA